MLDGTAGTVLTLVFSFAWLDLLGLHDDAGLHDDTAALRVQIGFLKKNPRLPPKGNTAERADAGWICWGFTMTPLGAAGPQGKLCRTLGAGPQGKLCRTLDTAGAAGPSLDFATFAATDVAPMKTWLELFQF